MRDLDEGTPASTSRRASRRRPPNSPPNPRAGRAVLIELENAGERRSREAGRFTAGGDVIGDGRVAGVARLIVGTKPVQ